MVMVMLVLMVILVMMVMLVLIVMMVTIVMMVLMISVTMIMVRHSPKEEEEKSRREICPNLQEEIPKVWMSDYLDEPRNKKTYRVFFLTGTPLKSYSMENLD